MRRHIERLALLVMIIFFVKISVNGELALLIHPRYFWLTYLSLPVILAMFWSRGCTHLHRSHYALLIVLIFGFSLGFFVDLQPLSASSSSQVNISTYNSSDALRARRFSNFGISTEDWELENWVAMLSINPEPANYEGQAASVSGFYFIEANGRPMVARHILSCCAADARIAGLYLNEKLPLKANEWVQVSGVFEINEGEERQAVVKIDSYEVIEPPKNPYIIN